MYIDGLMNMILIYKLIVLETQRLSEDADWIRLIYRSTLRMYELDEDRHWLIEIDRCHLIHTIQYTMIWWRWKDRYDIRYVCRYDMCTAQCIFLIYWCCVAFEKSNAANNISQDGKSFWVFTRCQVRVAALLAVEELCGEERSRTRKARTKKRWSQQSLIHHPRSPTIWKNRKW